LLGILSISLAQGSAVVLGLILTCCFLGYLYQGPPFRLGYLGLGELLCFPCFGPLGVGAAYYSQTGSFSWVSFWASLSLGLTTSLVLFCSHFHQVKDDRAAGKKSPIVRLGTARSAALIPVWCGVSLALMVVPSLPGVFPPWTLLSLLSLPIALEISRFIGRYHNQPEQVMNCKFLAIKFQFWSGLLFSLGFWLG
jgi:1,4-dihydroxy-2-naphthoate octaprenyltransferase